MESSTPGRGARLVERRIERKGLRPRVAASVIASAWIVGIVIFGILERLIDPDSFDNVWLGMWWATQTVTTVGYGDVVPQQTAGQVIAAILMVGGLSFFAVITGLITSVFVTRAESDRRASSDQELSQKLDSLRADLGAVRADLDRLVRGREEPPAST